jgi:hypothetical protein
MNGDKTLIQQMRKQIRFQENEELYSRALEYLERQLKADCVVTCEGLAEKLGIHVTRVRELRNQFPRLSALIIKCQQHEGATSHSVMDAIAFCWKSHRHFF